MELSVDRSFNKWWVFLVRGILFILVGIYMIASPAASFVALGFLFGLMILLAGISNLLHIGRDNNPVNRNWHLALGIIEIIFGIVLMTHIGTSVAILRIIVGLWFILSGITLFNISRAVRTTWLPKIAGVIIVIFGILILFDAIFGSMTIILLAAIAFIITGISNIWLAYHVKPRAIV